MTRSVAVLLFDGVEVLDACGPFEVFSVANRMRGPWRIVHARGGLQLSGG
jgi:putative intracellular protease/amidase